MSAEIGHPVDRRPCDGESDIHPRQPSNSTGPRPRKPRTKTEDLNRSFPGSSNTSRLRVPPIESKAASLRPQRSFRAPVTQPWLLLSLALCLQCWALAVVGARCAWTTGRLRKNAHTAPAQWDFFAAGSSLVFLLGLSSPTTKRK